MSDRRDPAGKRALFESTPVDPDIEPGEGRRAVFTATGTREHLITIECSRCGSRSRVSPLEAGLRILAISLWIPGRNYSRWLLCPSCRHRSWCRLELAFGPD